MKKMLLISAFGVLGFHPAFAATHAGLALCPQGAMDTPNVYNSNSLYVGAAHVQLSYGGSEPQFSSQIQWDQNGVVTLIRKNKDSIVLGQGVRPAKSSPCGIFPFTVSDNVQFEVHSKKGIPHPACDVDRGCHLVRPQDDTLTIHAGGEKITFIGRWG